MKDYDRYVIWLDYFDSERKRKGGRRVPLSSATRSPKVDELEEACKRLNLQPSAQGSKHPRSPLGESGYVSVRKSKPKQALIMRIAKELSAVRGMAQKRQSREEGRRK